MLRRWASCDSTSFLHRDLPHANFNRTQARDSLRNYTRDKRLSYSAPPPLPCLFLPEVREFVKAFLRDFLEKLYFSRRSRRYARNVARGVFTH